METRIEKIDTYIDIAIKKFSQANGYSELNYDHLRKVIRDYLLVEYDREVQELAFKMELEQSLGRMIDKIWYQKEFENIRYKFLTKVDDICNMDGKS